MPELPDIEVFTRNLNKVFAGHRLVKIKIINGRKLPDKPAAFTKQLAGRRLEKVYRSGKEMRFQFAKGTLMGLHLMLTGDVFIFEKKNEHHSTIAELYFENGTGLALTDRMKNARVFLNPVDKAGIDAISKELNYAYLKKALQRKANIKSLLMNQDVIRGIGNSYSDEILWEAGISPFSKASAIPQQKVKALVTIIKKVLTAEIKNIYKAQKGKVNVEVKEFLKIHSKTKTHSPTGRPIQIVQKGMMKTYFTDEQVLYE